jgi:hypothetical protein
MHVLDRPERADRDPTFSICQTVRSYSCAGANHRKKDESGGSQKAEIIGAMVQPSQYGGTHLLWKTRKSTAGAGSNPDLLHLTNTPVLKEVGLGYSLVEIF